jgi:hypothetical protein
MTRFIFRLLIFFQQSSRQYVFFFFFSFGLVSRLGKKARDDSFY